MNIMTIVNQYATENEGILKLAISIVSEAMSDYERMLLQVKKDPADYIARGRVAELERFFLSDYGQMLSFDHGQAIIEECKANAAAGRRARRLKTV